MTAVAHEDNLSVAGSLSFTTERGKTLQTAGKGCARFAGFDKLSILHRLETAKDSSLTLFTDCPRMCCQNVAGPGKEHFSSRRLTKRPSHSYI